MRLLHLHFGKDGGAERFFVKLAGALDRRSVAQAAFIRPGRAWRPELPAAMEAVEGVPRALTLPWQSWRRDRLSRRFKPDAILAWMWLAGSFLPEKAGPCRAVRLGDYPRELRSLRNADLVVCNTPGIVDRLRTLGWDRRVEVITNFTPVDPALPADRAAHGTPPGAFLVVAVGRLVEIKSYPVLIRAVARLPAAHLWIVGNGAEHESLARLVDELGAAGRVRFLGWRDNPAPYLAAADAVCLSSRHETLGNVILEGWAQGKPVVATRAPGPAWLIRHGDNGLLADVGDDGAVESHLRCLMADPSLARRLGQAGRSELDRRFSEESVCQAYLSALRLG